MLNTVHTLSMAATGYTPWVDVRRLTSVTVQTSCGDVNDPVGAITLEYSNDVPQIEAEKAAGTAPANSTALAVTASVTPSGSAWTNGYDGVGAKVSWAAPSAAPAFERIKYTRSSGGAADTLTVRWIGKVGF